MVPTPTVVQAAWALYGPLANEGGATLRRYTAEELAVVVDFTRRDRLLQEEHAFAGAQAREAPPARGRRSDREARHVLSRGCHGPGTSGGYHSTRYRSSSGSARAAQRKPT